MADIIPPAPPPVVLPGPSSSGPVAVAVMSDAGAAIQMLDGLLEAQAQARATRGAVQVVIADGVFQLKAQPGATLPAIPAGASLVLQSMGQGDARQMFLLAINGRPLAGVTLPAGLPPLFGQPGSPMMTGRPLPGGAPTLGGTIATPGMGTPPTPGQATPGPLGLTATLIRPAQMPGQGDAQPGMPSPQPAQGIAAASMAGLPPDLPAGTRLTVRIAGIIPPETAAAGPAMTPSPANPALPSGGAMPAPRPMLPASSLPPLAAEAAPPLLTGTVTAHPPGGHAVVQTPIGTLAVPTHADLPVGTGLSLELVGKPLPPAAALAPARPEGLTAQGWPALSESLDVLATSNQPQALEQLLRVVPQADTRLAASMVAFTGALRGGEVKALLPETTLRGIEKAGRKELAARLKGDLEALSEDAGRPVGGGDWRAYTMPFLSSGFIEPIRLFVRKAGDENGGRRGGGQGNDHRFVVDLNLTQLGRLQLDGLVRREDKLFDLIIRTDAPMTTEMRLDILGIFADASELVGTKGTVSFQAGGRWLELPPAPPAPTRLEV